MEIIAWLSSIGVQLPEAEFGIMRSCKSGNQIWFIGVIPQFPDYGMFIKNVHGSELK
ncbi:hypothetical protein SAMN05216312_108281 [Cohnella sp. OV330]|nr:hypothetical protein SAMN05216312_108281 [Cohnella sp. OV330]